MAFDESRTWRSVKDLELERSRPALAARLRDNVITPLLHDYGEPVNASTLKYVLRMSLDDRNACYVHTGRFTPNVLERFSLGLLRSNIGRRGPGVKPRGVGARTWHNGVMTPGQEAVMVEALNDMAAVLGGTATVEPPALRPVDSWSDLFRLWDECPDGPYDDDEPEYLVTIHPSAIEAMVRDGRMKPLGPEDPDPDLDLRALRLE